MVSTGQTNRMNRPFVTAIVLAASQALALASCAVGGAHRTPIGSDLREETVRGEKPDAADGVCWASDETPAVIETVTEQVAEDVASQGEGSYRTETRLEIIEPRVKIWFRTPCAQDLSPEVIATLQRALAARGLFSLPADGVLDDATKAAIRAYQVRRGLNSDQLSLTAARDLGVIVSDFGETTATNG